MSSRIIQASHDPKKRPGAADGCSHGSSSCVRRRDLGALGVAGAAAIALTGCGPDRGGLEAGEIQPDDSGAVKLDEIPEWTTAIVNFGGGQKAFVAVVRGEGEDVHGWEAYCTHQGCALEPQGPVLDCPCHGSTFDSDSGEVKGGPAEAPLVPVELKVADGKVTRA